MIIKKWKQRKKVRNENTKGKKKSREERNEKERSGKGIGRNETSLVNKQM